MQLTIECSLSEFYDSCSVLHCSYWTYALVTVVAVVAVAVVVVTVAVAVIWYRKKR